MGFLIGIFYRLKFISTRGTCYEHLFNYVGAQCYVVFVLAHGGKDLESFVLLNFNEARTLLLQVVTMLHIVATFVR